MRRSDYLFCTVRQWIISLGIEVLEVAVLTRQIFFLYLPSLDDAACPES